MLHLLTCLSLYMGRSSCTTSQNILLYRLVLARIASAKLSSCVFMSSRSTSRVTDSLCAKWTCIKRYAQLRSLYSECIFKRVIKKTSWKHLFNLDWKASWSLIWDNWSIYNGIGHRSITQFKQSLQATIAGLHRFFYQVCSLWLWLMWSKARYDNNYRHSTHHLWGILEVFSSSLLTRLIKIL